MYPNNFNYPSGWYGFNNLSWINPTQYYNHTYCTQESKETLENPIYIRENNMTNKDLLTTSFKQQADEFIKMACFSIDPCTVATAIALSDMEVFARLIEKIREGNIFRGIRCLKYTPTFELIYVYFDFDCPPGVFCLVKPSFAAVVNFITRKVVDIVDPFPISEFDTLKNKLEMPTSLNGPIRWPNPNDIQVRVFVENNKLVAVAYYKGVEKHRIVLADLNPELCGGRGDVDLFSISILGIGITVYLSHLWICVKPDESKVEYSFQIWARSGSAKTKLTNTITGTLDWEPNSF